MDLDPVCGKVIKERDPQKATEVNGDIVFFCSQECKRQFDRNRKVWEEEYAKIGRRAP